MSEAPATLSQPLPDSPFLPDSKIQYAWDSTSVGIALACPRQYYYRILKGWTPRDQNKAIALDFGILFHKGLEIFYGELSKGMAFEDALRYTITSLPKEPRYENLPTEQDIEAIEQHFVDAAASDDHDDDGINLRNSKVRTRYHLMRALVWYILHYGEHDQFKTLVVHDLPAVEVSFRVELPLEVEGSQIIYCGHIDRGVNFNDHTYVLDYKTTKSLTRQWFQAFELSHQFTGYIYAGQIIFDQPVSGAFIDGIALQVGGVKFGRSPTKRTEGQFAEWMKTIQKVINDMAQCHDDEFYPMNTSSCYFCEFKSICAQPPEYRDMYLKQNFRQEPAWNPLENR